MAVGTDIVGDSEGMCVGILLGCVVVGNNDGTCLKISILQRCYFGNNHEACFADNVILFNCKFD